MSGHSKWSTIKRKKGAADIKRSKIFGKLIREITVAAKIGGPDSNTNPRLRSAIATARIENMPMDNINRAISKGVGEDASQIYEELVYEGYAPGGAAILVDVLTDNKNRTAADVRHVFSKHGGSLGGSNTVAWIFERKGFIAVKKIGIEEEALIELVLDAGAGDMQDGDDVWEILTDVDKYDDVVEALEKKGIETVESKIARIPKTVNILNRSQAEKVMNLLEALEDLDDVQNVWSNFDYEE